MSNANATTQQSAPGGAQQAAPLQHSYTTAELMVVAGARMLADGQIAVVGLGIPLVAGGLAQRTHAPRLRMLNEIGVADFWPVPTPPASSSCRAPGSRGGPARASPPDPHPSGKPPAFLVRGR